MPTVPPLRLQGNAALGSPPAPRDATPASPSSSTCVDPGSPPPPAPAEDAPLLGRTAPRLPLGWPSTRALLSAPGYAVGGGLVGGLWGGFFFGSAAALVVVHARLGASAYDAGAHWTPTATQTFDATLRAAVKMTTGLGAATGAAFPLLTASGHDRALLMSVSWSLGAAGAVLGGAAGTGLGSAVSNAALWVADSHSDEAVQWARELGAACGAVVGCVGAMRWLHRELGAATTFVADVEHGRRPLRR